MNREILKKRERWVDKVKNISRNRGKFRKLGKTLDAKQEGMIKK